MAQHVLSRPNNPTEARRYFEDKMTYTTGPVELERVIHDDNIVIIDVREEEDYRKGHLPGAVNLPKARWDTAEGLSKDKQNVIYCYSIVCHLAAAACVKFADRGYPVMELDGGFRSWQEHGMDVEK